MATDEFLALIRAPAFTVDVLRRFAVLIERAKNDNAPLDMVKAEAEKIDPRLGGIIEDLRDKPSWMLLMIFMLMLAALKTCNFDLKVDTQVDLNKLFDQIVASGFLQKPKLVPYNVLAQPGQANDSEKQSPASNDSGQSSKGEGSDQTKP